jgi:DNA polymerase elongation subunit (family B)
MKALTDGIDIPRPESLVLYDIEAGAHGNFPDPKHDRVLTIATYEPFTGRERCFSFDKEEETLLAFRDYVDGFDYLMGYYSYTFDDPFYQSRMRKYRIDFPMVIHLDCSWFFKEAIDGKLPYYEQVRTSLNAACEYYGLGQKLDIDASKMYWYFYNNRQYLIDYNLQDVRLTAGILKHVWNYVLARWWQAKKTGLQMDQLSPFQLSQQLMFKQAYSMGTIAVPRRQEYYSTAAGGFVFDGLSGLHERGISLDVVSMYPSVTRTFNICLSTIVDPESPNACMSEKLWFTKEKRGFNPAAQEDVFNRRLEVRAFQKELDEDSEEWKEYEAEQEGLKTILVSMTGVFNHNKYPYANSAIFESVTLTSQAIIQECAKIMDEIGWVVTHGDTDSVFVKHKDDEYSLDELVEKIPELEAFLNAELRARLIPKYNLNPEWYCIQINAERVYRRYWNFTKKRYVGWLYWKKGRKSDDIQVMGVQIKKKNYTRFVRKTLYDIMGLILKEAQSEYELKQFLLERKEELLRGEHDMDLIVTQSVKPIESYKVKQPHVRAAIKLGELFRPYKNVRYVWTTINTVEPIIDGKPFPEITRGGRLRQWNLVKGFVKENFGIGNIEYEQETLF